MTRRWRPGWPAAAGLAAAIATACDDPIQDAREGQIVSVMAVADEAIIRARPGLAAGKYARMASGPIDFMRGSAPVYRSDLRTGVSFLGRSRFALDVPLVPSHGDPHPENFGVLVAGDGSRALEANDFDAADRAPYLWDVRRLATGMALAAMVANSDDPAARARATAARREVARAAVDGYARAIEAAARGVAFPRVVDAAGNAILADLFRRSARDAATRRELDELTELDGMTHARRLRRGPIDPQDPQRVLADLPSDLLSTLAPAVERYRRTLLVPRLAEELTIVDAAREFGSGVASWARVRVLILVRGPSDDPSDDVLLELKELADSGWGGLYGQAIHADDVTERVRAFSRRAWARPDGEALWGTTTWLGMPCQIRLESAAEKTVRVARMAGEAGGADSIADLGLVLGGLVARMHASGDDGLDVARAILARLLVDPQGFLDEQADVAAAYAEVVVADHARFARAIRRADVGLRLGIPFDSADAPRPDPAALFGSPPPLPGSPPAPSPL